MRAVLQRVSQASVRVEEELVGSIGMGLLALVAVQEEDGPEDLAFLCRKILQLRLFPDEEGRMNRSLLEVGGEILVISQFTLYGDCRKGNRPSFSRAAQPEKARLYYERLVRELQASGLGVQQGRFGALMQVSLVNDGPVTVIVDSRKEFY